MEEKGIQLRLQVRHHDRDPARGVTADEIAEVAEFFSFGTNDLTQMTYGYSRDDAERNFLLKYVEKDPAVKPVPDHRPRRRGQADGDVRRGGPQDPPGPGSGYLRRARRRPGSIEWCHLIGNNYVSCSPFRVPVARLAAAQAALKYRN